MILASNHRRGRFMNGSSRATRARRTRSPPGRLSIKARSRAQGATVRRGPPNTTVGDLGRTDHDPHAWTLATKRTGETFAGWSSGGAERATFEACRIDSELRKTARSAVRREFPAREIAELEASSSAKDESVPSRYASELLRYSSGVLPVQRLKARWNDSTWEKPAKRAISASGVWQSRTCSVASLRRAASSSA